MLTYNKTIKNSKVLTDEEKQIFYDDYCGKLEDGDYDYEDFDGLRDVITEDIWMHLDDNPTIHTTEDVEKLIEVCNKAKRMLICVDKLQREN